MEIKIKVDAAAAIKEVRGIKDSQLPFALAKSLTMTAEDAQGKMIEELPQHFTLRTKWYMPQTPFGFKKKPATKTDFHSEVYSNAPWLPDFEEGATRTPEDQTFAVPTDVVRRTKRELITKGQRPKALMHKIRPAFIKPMADKAGIFYRRTKRSPAQLMYALIKKAVIKPRLKFQDTVEKTVVQKFSENFTKAFEDALRKPK